MLEPGFWKKSATVLLTELKTTDTGLSSQEAEQRLARYGSNDATAPNERPAGFASSSFLATLSSSSSWSQAGFRP